MKGIKMTVYLIAEIKVTDDKWVPDYAANVHSLVEKHGGWKLHGSYFSVIGRLNTVVDVWEIPDANAVQTTLEIASQDPEFQKWIPVIEECVEDETLQLMTKLPV